MTADPAGGASAPSRVLLFGMHHRSVTALRDVLQAIGINEIQTSGVDRNDPPRPVLIDDPAELFAIKEPSAKSDVVLIYIDHDESVVARSVADRFDVTAEAGRATWRTYRARALELLCLHRHIVVDGRLLAERPDAAVRAVVDQLAREGVRIEPSCEPALRHVVTQLRALTPVAGGPPELRRAPEPVEAMLSRHEQLIARLQRTVSALRRRVAAGDDSPPAVTALAPSDPSSDRERAWMSQVAGYHAYVLEAISATSDASAAHLQRAEVERAHLMEVVEMFRRDAVAIVSSRRWRVGDWLGRLASLRFGRRRPELASTRLLALSARLDGLELISLAPAPPLVPEPPALAPAPPVVQTPSGWRIPEPRQYDVIVLANVGWHFRQQRPHQLARAFARAGHRVFYGSIGEGRLGDEHTVERGVLDVELQPSHAYDRYLQVPDDALVDEWMVAIERLRQRHRIDDAVVHVQLQSWTRLAWALRDTYGWRVVYDCMDEWDGFPGIGEALLEAERELVAGADLVVTTAEVLRRKWSARNPNTVLVRNAADAEFFAREAIASDVIAHLDHPIIGFTGGLASWIDFSLIAAVARARPDWTFVLVGDVFVSPVELHGLDRMDNVVMTGLQPYPLMPRYLFWIDVAIIPFVVDRISAAVDPVKFYEYAAAGKPIVSTPMPELAEHRDLYYEASDPATFEAAIEQALGEDSTRRQRRVALAASNTWAHRYSSFDAATRKLWPAMSLVVVTFGQLDHTRRCLESIIANTSHPALEILLVDNGSSDGTPAYLRYVAQCDTRVRCFLNEDNLGFAAANNQALASATGDVLILLNNDTEVFPGWHVPLLEHLRDPAVGLVGPRSDNVGNEARIDVPEQFATDLAGFTRHLRREHEGERFEIRMLGMFCVAMRREVFAAVGPLDEGYGIGMFEDDDYAERVRAAGWKIVCARDAFVRHVGQATFKQLLDTGEYDRLWAANKQRFETRWGPWRAQEAWITDGEDG